MEAQGLSLGLRLSHPMDIVCVSPLRAASLVWEPRPSAWVLTVVVKATFTLRPAESLLAAEQDPLHDVDDHWNNDPTRSVRAPADLVPVKLHPEVMLSGHAFSPGGRPARFLTARLAVGSLDKHVEIHADRSLGPDGTIREGVPFTSFPLVYERAAQGPQNPVGIPAQRDTMGARVLPNLVRPNAPLASPDAPIDPIGFAPFAAEWAVRRDKLGAHDELARGTFHGKVLPPDVDMAFFNQAPPDQILTALHEDEWIALENLHPSEPRLVTRLPGVRPAVFVDRAGHPPQKISLRPDTLWIDTDRAIATLTFRGPVALERPDEPGRIVIGMDPPGLESKWEDLQRAADRKSSVPPAPSAPLCPDEPGDLGPSAPPLLSREETVVWSTESTPPPSNAAPGPWIPSGSGGKPTLAGASLESTEPASEPNPRADLCELLWFDPAIIGRLRRCSGFNPILTALAGKPRDIDLDEPRVGEPLTHVAERREVFELLAKGHPTDTRGLLASLTGATRGDGKLVPPLALLHGELEPVLDPIASLRAAVAIASIQDPPHEGAAQKALEQARKALADQEAPIVDVVAKDLLTSLREALGEGIYALETRLQASLVPTRKYEYVELFGARFLRAHLELPSDPTPLPAYLPAALGSILPLMRRFQVRILGETHLRLDEREPNTPALRIFALARTTPRTSETPST